MPTTSPARRLAPPNPPAATDLQRAVAPIDRDREDVQSGSLPDVEVAVTQRPDGTVVVQLDSTDGRPFPVGVYVNGELLA